MMTTADRIERAKATRAAMDSGMLEALEAYRPARANQRDWPLVVAVCQRPGEDIYTCAKRLATYVEVHLERYGEVPGLNVPRLAAQEQAQATEEPQP